VASNSPAGSIVLTQQMERIRLTIAAAMKRTPVRARSQERRQRVSVQHCDPLIPKGNGGASTCSRIRSRWLRISQMLKSKLTVEKSYACQQNQKMNQ